MTDVKAGGLAIIQRFTNNYVETALTFENEDFDGDTPDEYIRVLIQYATGNQHTMGKVGNRKFRRRGIVIAQIYVPLNRGLGRCREIAVAVSDLIEGVTADGIWYMSSVFRSIGPTQGKFMGTLTTAFSHDETK